MDKNLKIIQNQRNFTIPLYKKHVTPLPSALQDLGFPKWICRLNLENFWSGVALYLCSFKFDVVVSVSLVPSFVYGMLCRILKKPHSLHICKEFYLETSNEKMSITKKIRLNVLRYALKNVNAIIINASGEADDYSKILSIPKDRFKFIAWPSNISNPKIFKENKGYFLSVGKSLRDWKTFFEAVKFTPYKYIVIATNEDAESFPCLENVTVLKDVGRDVYLDVLVGAKGLILSLKPTIRSTGQASFLEAMAYGKPVIASNVVGVRDYLRHEDNALLCDPEDGNSLKECIRRIEEDDETRKRISFNGFNDIVNKFNKYRYSEEMLRIVYLLKKYD